MEYLTGRTALVTGAARGIGLATAGRLAAKGAALVLVDVDAAAVEAASRSIAGHVLSIRADVSCPSDVQRAVRTTVARFGGLDILVNNAAVCPLTPLDKITEAEWDRVLAVNLKGAFLCTQAALSEMQKARWGRVINVASVAAQMGGIAVGVHYAASKSGILGLTKSFARHLAPFGITVNAIAPGAAETDLTATWPEAIKQGLTAQTPLGRLIRPDEIAETVVFLCSPPAAAITGATIDINAGLFMR
jgi:3-oxoacyl-[acyl-carrier protein] reductase